MKKTLVVLLILAVAGGLFAQDITFSGDVKTGLRFRAESGVDNPADPLVDLYHDDAAGPQFTVYGTYTADNYGLKLGIIGDASADPIVNVDNIFLWFKPLDVLKISAGKGFGDIPNVYDWATGGGPGIQFLVTPIEGLTIGLTLNAPGNNKGLGDWIFGTPAGETTDKLYSVTAASASNMYAAYKPEYFLQETAFGVKYEADLFKAHVALKLDSEADINDPLSWEALGLGKINFVTPDVATSKVPSEKEIFASAAVEVTAVPNLTIDVAGKVENLNDWDTEGAGRAEIHEKFAYKISDPFNVYLTAKEVLYSFEDSPMGLHGEAGLGYKINDTYTVNLALGADNWLLSDAFGDNEGFHNDNIWIKPSVAITVGEKAAITFYYKATIQNNSAEGATDRPLKSLAQVNFVWSY
jgi:hypothetical protein